MKMSNLWEFLAKNKFPKVDEGFLSSFREPGNANNRLAAWDPRDCTMRYFKFLLFHQLQTKDESFYLKYSKIGPTSIGNPVWLKVTTGGGTLEVNLDHFLSIEEFTFLEENNPLREVRHTLEIGAGFGRTAQELISLIPTLDSYTIVDLPEILELSRAYLRRAFQGRAEFKKIRFVNALSLPSGRYKQKNDLVINIDSFQEMPQETIKFYFRNFIEDAKFFYSKNAVGKYSPESIGLQGLNEKQLFDVFSLGLSTDVIDIFDERELKRARARHVQQYRPGENFSIITEAPLGIFPYYHNVLYGKISKE
jgi:putative sugar O-methyltransferase